MNKKIISKFLSVLVCAVVCSGCGDATPEEVEMPEIVFITSHHYYDENIKGYFITNEGKMKMYDFRNIAPDEQYDLLEVMDQLDSALCTEMDRGGIIIKEEDLPQISKEKLFEYYEILKKINKNSKIVRCESGDTALSGYGHFYGIRYNRKDEQEIITLNGWGMFFENNLDKDAKKISVWELFVGLL